MPKLALALLPLGAAAALCAGCGGSSGSNASGGTTTAAVTPTKPAASIRSIAIKESEFKIDPATVNEPEAGTYVFQIANTGSYPHALAVEGNGFEKRSHTVEPGSSDTFTVVIPKGGTYELYCPIDGHKAKGMEGKLIVAGGSGSGSGGGGTTTTGGTTTSGGNGY
jgi:plastocyanin